MLTEDKEIKKHTEKVTLVIIIYDNLLTVIVLRKTFNKILVPVMKIIKTIEN